MPQSQWIILFAAAMVAGIVLVRLYLILGRRGAQPPQPSAAPVRPQSLPVRPPTPTAADSEAGGLLAIQLADREFETAKFLEGARSAYGIILRAFESGDNAALRPLVSDEVYEAFGAAMRARGDEPAPFHFADIKDARITAAAVENAMMEITVTFVTSFEAQAGAPHAVTDVWTFARPVGAADPNWTLVATSGDPQ